jgi:hypothetical protein
LAFYVDGGVFTDTDWQKIEPGTEEVYGPYKTYEEALAKWRGAMGWKIDTCTHRLFIKLM